MAASGVLSVGAASHEVDLGPKGNRNKVSIKSQFRISSGPDNLFTRVCKLVCDQNCSVSLGLITCR